MSIQLLVCVSKSIWIIIIYYIVCSDSTMIMIVAIKWNKIIKLYIFINQLIDKGLYQKYNKIMNNTIHIIIKINSNYYSCLIIINTNRFRIIIKIITLIKQYYIKIHKIYYIYVIIESAYPINIFIFKFINLLPYKAV